MDKSIQKKSSQQFMAGISPSDSNIELVADTASRRTLWIKNGKTKYFTQLPQKYFELLKDAYLSDTPAVEDLQTEGDIQRQVELYAYYMFGDLDNVPDIQNDKLGISENFRSGKTCISQGWATKKFTIDNQILNNRDITILDCISEDLPDKAIAERLGVSVSTFNWHKQKLLAKTNCYTKVALALKAQQQKIILA